jgi:hypothetical protein
VPKFCTKKRVKNVDEIDGSMTKNTALPNFPIARIKSVQMLLENDNSTLFNQV